MRMRRLILFSALFWTCVELLVDIAMAEARPGGGHSYSGGGGGGGGEGAAIFELIYWLIRLAIAVPHVGIPLIVIVVAFLWFAKRQRRGLTDWDSGPPIHRRRTQDLDEIREVDPEFSTVLFSDFVYRLYASARQAQGAKAKLDELAPYIHELVRAQMLEREPIGVPVSNVVIGGMRAIGVNLHNENGQSVVQLEFEANYTAMSGEFSGTFFVVEQWTLVRNHDVVSKAHDASNYFPCPNCGAAFESSDQQRCEYCGEVVDNGRFSWCLVHAQETFSNSGPSLLTGNVVERGNELPTIVDPAVHMRMGELISENPALNEGNIVSRIQLIYATLNTAWMQRDLTAVRGLVSDGMFDYLTYWIDAYKDQKLVNLLEEMEITNLENAKLTRDKHYDALTIRLWATGYDSTVPEDKVSSGRPMLTSRRLYSEYWTLIRAAGVRGEPSALLACPNCGAELKISMAGNCEFCAVHVTGGEFDWVLSKIEQDDSYRG